MVRETLIREGVPKTAPLRTNRREVLLLLLLPLLLLLLLLWLLQLLHLLLLLRLLLQ